MEYGIHLFTPQISLQQLKLSVSYVIIPSEARFINLSHTQLASHVLIAQQGRNSSCEYFYRSLGCRQLTSSSCDVRVHFRVARQCYFKYESNPVGHYHVLFKLKCISLRLLPSKLLAFPENLYPWIHMLHWGKLKMNWFVLCRSMWPIDQIKDWFQLHTSIHRWPREWIKTEIMQNGFEIMPLS